MIKYLFIFLLSSVTLAQVKIPLADEFWKLYRQRNELGINDCSNKCGRLARLLKDKGYDASIVVIKPHRSRMRHALVKVVEKGKTYYLDPVQGIKVMDLKDCGTLVRLIDYDDIDLEGTDFL